MPVPAGGTRVAFLVVIVLALLSTGAWHVPASASGSGASVPTTTSELPARASVAFDDRSPLSSDRGASTSTRSPAPPLSLRDSLPVGPVQPASGGDPVAYSAAAAAIATAVSGYDGAAWSITAAAGVDTAQALELSVANLTAGCSLSWIAPVRTNLYFPSTPSTAGVGTSNAYYFALVEESTPYDELLAVVDNGTPTLEFTESPTTSCGTDTSPAVPSDVIDSPEVVTVGEAAVGTFAADHPHERLEWGVTAFDGTPEWFLLLLTGCGAEEEVVLDGYDSGVEASYGFGGCEYSIVVSETGLPAGTEWFAGVNDTGASTTNGSVSVSEPNGTYTVTPSLPGYEASPTSMSVTIAGTNGSAAFSFSKQSGTYSVTFKETGLPTGTFWQVGLFYTDQYYYQSGTGSTQTFWVLEGSYSYYVQANGYNATPTFGSVTVTTSDRTVDISISTDVTSQVTFVESGLPGGGYWTVEVTSRGGNEESTGTSLPSIEFDLSKGNYTYSVSTEVTGLQPKPPTGGLAVASASTTVSVAFADAPGYYTADFVASGLPSDSAFNLSVGSAPTFPVGGDTVAAVLPNGTAEFEIQPVYGYVASPDIGNVTIVGAGTTVDIAFRSASMYLLTVTESGLPAGSEWTTEYANVTSHAFGAMLDLYAPNGNATYVIGTSVPGFVATPATGHLRIDGGPVELAVVFGPLVVSYLVTFHETGLPAGTEWSVTLGTQSNSTVGRANDFFEPNGSYSYTVSPVLGYVPIPSSGSVTIAASIANVSIVFRAAPTYPVRFSESGLAAGDSWSVTLGGVELSSTAGTISFDEPNGSYAYTVATSASYLPTPVAGTEPVAGVPVSVSVEFRELFEVKFLETGLPAGTRWSVNLSGALRTSDAASISFSELNGTFFFTTNATGYLDTPSEGSVNVAGGLVETVISFSAVGEAPIRFTETGLAANTVWWVNVNGTNVSSTVSTVYLLEPEGTYGYAVGATGYAATPSSGRVVMDGFSALVAVAFAPVGRGEYVVTFSESGLPIGTGWQVTLNGLLSSGTGTTISFPERNGSYLFSIPSTDGYGAATGVGSVTVAGGPVRVETSFSVPPKSAGLFGLPGLEGYGLLGAGVAGIVVVASVLIVRRTKRASPSDRAMPPPRPPTPPS